MVLPLEGESSPEIPPPVPPSYRPSRFLISDSFAARGGEVGEDYGRSGPTIALRLEVPRMTQEVGLKSGNKEEEGWWGSGGNPASHVGRFVLQALKELRAKAQKGAIGGAGLKKSGKK
ncbi:hypothetical protein SAY86_026855 [Trapa natans]|uniref:Uncharacterized protein n=1 Tax=Trapa natans TaxID=22666 RepID=A0AAN7KEY5_TRANT|nr:hypothetical protein SAY86_026855 [Trapa natans]